MKAFFMEYGLVTVTFIAVIFAFWYFSWLPAQYSKFEINMMSTITGVEVEDILAAQDYVEEG